MSLNLPVVVSSWGLSTSLPVGGGGQKGLGLFFFFSFLVECLMTCVSQGSTTHGWYPFSWGLRSFGASSGVLETFLFVRNSSGDGWEPFGPWIRLGLFSVEGTLCSPIHIFSLILVLFQDESRLCPHHRGSDQRQQIHPESDERCLRQHPGSGTLLFQREVALQGGRTHDLTLPCAQQAALRFSHQKPRRGLLHLGGHPHPTGISGDRAELHHSIWEEAGLFI